MQYVLCFVCGVLVYRVEIEVIELVLVHVGEPLLLLGVGAALRVRTAGAVATTTEKANASTVILIGTPTDNTCTVVAAVNNNAATASTSTSTTTTTAIVGTASKANRTKRPGADNATSIAIGAPETGTKLTKRRLWRYCIRPGRLYEVLLRLLLLMVLFLVEFVVLMVILFGFLKHRVQFATTAGAGATRPRTTGTGVREGIGVLLGYCIVAVQIGRGAPRRKHVALLKRRGRGGG